MKDRGWIENVFRDQIEQRPAESPPSAGNFPNNMQVGSRGTGKSNKLHHPHAGDARRDDDGERSVE